MRLAEDRLLLHFALCAGERVVLSRSRLDGAGRELLRSPFLDALQRAVEDYNGMVGTLERRVLVTARRMRDLDVTDTDLPEPRPLLEGPRPLTAEELLTGPVPPAA